MSSRLCSGVWVRVSASALLSFMESFGESKIRLSELFVEHSAAFLEEFLNRRLDDATYVASFVDAKISGQQSIVFAIDITTR